jgi:predicted phage terminase large subunit-like protein
LAISTGERSDFTAVIVFAVSPERDIFIIDVIAERIAPNKHIDVIKNIYLSHNLTLIGIESVQYQTALIQNAREIGLPVKELRPDKDKFSRAIPMSALVESGKVFFKSNAAWLGDFEHELTAFPNSNHDDMTDAFAYIWQMLSYNSGLMPISLSRKR